MAKAPARKRTAAKPGIVSIKAKDSAVQATQEQITYATILGNGRKVGLAGVIVAFTLYVSGIIAPKTPLTDISQYWALSSEKYLSATGIKPGWAWLGMYQYGDMLNYFGIAVLGIISIICYIAIIPKLLRNKDYTFAGIAMVEVLVLTLAASGIISVGE